MSNPRIDMALIIFAAVHSEVDLSTDANWLYYPLPQLHPDEIATRERYLALADETLSMLRAHLAGVSTLLRGMADDRAPGPVQRLAYEKAEQLDHLLGVGSLVE